MNKQIIITIFLISLMASGILLLSCEKTPTEPTLTSAEEQRNIPFDELTGKIAFRRILTDKPGYYYFMLLDGDNNDLHGIAYFDTYVPTNLMLSPDGRQILFSYFIFNGQTRGHLWQLYSMFIENLYMYSISPSLYDDSYATWSPDGMKIAFWSNRLLESSMWVFDFDLDSSYYSVDIDKITRTRAAWDSDSKNFIFASSDSNSKPTLYKFELSTSSIEPIYTDELTTNEVIFKHPVFSHDNKLLAFVKAYKNKFDEIWILNIELNDAFQLTTGFSDWYPAWSPDGNKIIFSRGNHLYLIDIESSDLKQVTFGDHTNEYPSWIP